MLVVEGVVVVVLVLLLVVDVLDDFVVLRVVLEVVEVVVVDKIPSDSGDLVETKSCFCFRLASSCASSRFLCSS